METKLNVAGIMTGNSLDAVDVASFRAVIDEGGVKSFEQIDFHSVDCSPELRDGVLDIKARFASSGGLLNPDLDTKLTQTFEAYHRDVNNAVTAAREHLLAAKGVELDLIGFHGQTVGHAPPSVTASGQRPYTIQMVDGAKIADAQGVVTVADFRSDDLLNGGEGAPFAPGFNALLTPALGVERAVFINAGNTSNIAVINSATQEVRGWDCGPCNQFPDQLMRAERGVSVDEHGAIAQSGVVKRDLIEKLWHQAVLKQDGTNALEIEGPRSFDPQWYKLPQELSNTSEPFENRIRTVVAFSAYCVAHSLAVALRDGYQPELILLFGGGWKNPALMRELTDLCSGKAEYVLTAHKELFGALPKAIIQFNDTVKISDDVGLPSNGMEAGIFAFAAVQKILNQPFTTPSFTKCAAPTVCGAVYLPQSGKISPALVDMNLTDDRKLFHDNRLSRAALPNQ